MGVHLWAQAVRAAGSDDVAAIRRALRGQRFQAPEGEVRVDPETQHLWKTPRVARITEQGDRGDRLEFPRARSPGPVPGLAFPGAVATVPGGPAPAAGAGSGPPPPTPPGSGPSPQLSAEKQVEAVARAAPGAEPRVRRQGPPDRSMNGEVVGLQFLTDRRGRRLAGAGAPEASDARLQRRPAVAREAVRPDPAPRDAAGTHAVPGESGGRPGPAPGHAAGDSGLRLDTGERPVTPDGHEPETPRGPGHPRVGPDPAPGYAPGVAGYTPGARGLRHQPAQGHAAGVPEPDGLAHLRPVSARRVQVPAVVGPGRDADHRPDAAPGPEHRQLEHQRHPRHRPGSDQGPAPQETASRLPSRP